MKRGRACSLFTFVSFNGNSKPRRMTSEHGGPFIQNNYQTAAVSGHDFL